MTKHKSSFGIWMLIIFIILLSLLDIGTNILSFIPFIGGVFETISEVIIEIIQIILTVIIVLVGRK